MKKLLLFPLLVLLSACSIEPNTPQHAVEKALSALQHQNSEQFNQISDSTLYDYILDDTNFIPNVEMSEQEAYFYESLIPYLQSFDYEIITTNITDKTATVTVELTYYDISACINHIQPIVLQQLKDYNSQSMDDYYVYMAQEFYNYIEGFKTLTTQREIQLERKNHQWRLTIDDPSAFIYYLYVLNE